MCISTQSRSHLKPIQALRFTFLLCLSWILPQSGSWYLHLAYIQVTSHLHPGPPNCILVPSEHHLIPIQVSRCVSHLHPGPFSTGELYLSSILVPYHHIHVSRCASQLNPGPISTPSRFRELCLLSTQAPRFTFHLCLSWISPQSGSSYLHLAYIQVTSHLHPGPPNRILVPSKHHLKPIHVSRCVSHLHPGPFSTGELYLSSILVPYHHIHVSRCASQLNPGPISTPSRSRDLSLLSTQAPRFTFIHCLRCILPQSGSWYLHLTYIQVTSHLHPGPPNCILIPSTHHPKPIQVSRCVSHLHPGPFSTGELYLSSILVPYHHIHVSRCASQLNPGPISTPPRFRDLCLLSTQAPRFTFHLCLSWILLQSRSWYLHLAYIQVTSHLHPGPPNCILVPSKHHLKCIHVSRCVSHLHPGPLSTGELYLSSIPVPYHPIHVSRCASHLNPGPISTPSRLSDSRFFFVSVESYLNLGPDIYISPTSRLHLTSIQLHQIAS